MKDMKCPYCGAEWEHDYDDLSYTNGEGEYECPACKRIFIMGGELEPVFFAETAENYYERRIVFAKNFVEYHKDKINQSTLNGDKTGAEHYKKMLDIYYLPDLRELEEALELCVKHNRKVGDEEMEDRC